MYRKYPYYYNFYPYPCLPVIPVYYPNYLGRSSNQYTSYNNEADYDSKFDFSRLSDDDAPIQLIDYGPQPFVVDIDKATKQNNNFRTALWTGSHLQLTLMSINPGDDIGLEMHPNVDQFIRVEEGKGIVRMGNSRNNLDFEEKVEDDFAIIIPAGKWHNVINTGNKPLKVYSIYAPPNHPHSTVHVTKEDAEAAEDGH
ncbi:MAG: cupin domain-containing protein [Clostridium tyrobutyricum]|jgi:mannose-6-phosphate isomerase-like protein (cupin superfamily)|uniref:cupin domain-containing protein n=1 Tax=Clostridium tyrobutyricum TaxID=1519 RepID=UPI0018A91A39|nr:cupin domain-containing protein [Clostridium tyrobutyricum]MBV4430943.1 cupin domain-containing protein [Clostridium tyrobutyricum]MBV4446848.1 cupin domain-containing protein [Clostridium tyrobutyricum]MCH4198886.1 cupin domain-containing protein [Clostridium tyrobutyricum]MCH4236414.1 cupin domain-containing protein [Clostridium tyrobutyricum]MCH4258265.1 cupin domain-containing protein [Clostridium tyrobutyricum]